MHEHRKQADHAHALWWYSLEQLVLQPEASHSANMRTFCSLGRAVEVVGFRAFWASCIGGMALLLRMMQSVV